jgi:hypothetical protein
MQADDRNEIEKTATELLHPASRQLFRHWEALRAERPCPTRGELVLPRLAALLPNLSILEKSPRGQWHYRLAGTKVCDLLQQPMTGKDALAGFDNFERDVVGKTFDISQTRLQPCLVRMRLISTANRVEAAELVGLPVQDEGTGQVMLFGGLFGFGDDESPPAMLLRRELVSARLIWTEHENGDRLMAQVGRVAPPRLRVIQGGLSVS